MTEFEKLMQRCGLSNHSAAKLLDVRIDNVRRWKNGKKEPPDDVLSILWKFAEQRETMLWRKQND